MWKEMVKPLYLSMRIQGKKLLVTTIGLTRQADSIDLNGRYAQQ
jgi:hypothetical protein